METALRLGVLVAFVFTGLSVWLLVDARGRLRDRLTGRLYYGVPWGTLIVVTFVLGIYLLVQGGLRHWHDPVVLPFRSWSYLYPTGLLSAAFTHSSPGHLTGNLLAALALGSVAEYAWGHYPPATRRRDRSLAAFGTAADGGVRAVARPRVRRWLETPWIRAFVAFPLAVLVVGLVSSLFFLGPVIGFSGVVFTLGGFALVHYPVATIVALLGTSVLRTVYLALLSPVVRAGTSANPPGPPSWATTAVQGHALGMLVGVLLGLAVLYHRDERPDVLAVFVAVLVYATTRDLWAVYWFEGEGVYVLHRALGLVLVLALAVLVTAAVATSDRPVTWPIDAARQRVDRVTVPSGQILALGWIALVGIGLVVGFVVAVALGAETFVVVAVGTPLAVALALPALLAVLPEGHRPDPPSARLAAVTLLLVATVLVAGPAVVPNLVTLGDEPVPGEGSVTVEDYEVTYEEGVRDGMIPAISLPGLEERTNVTTSGVVVVSEERELWSTEVSRQYLESEGSATVQVGGVGWRETVDVERTGWQVAGNATVYAVDLGVDGNWTRSFESPPSRSEPTVANHTAIVIAALDDFWIQVERDGERVGSVRLPEEGEERTLGGLTLRTERVDDHLAVFAEADGTSVRIAQRETY